jgi:hypothetical protein
MHGTEFYFWLGMLVISVILYTVFIVTVRKFGKGLIDRLFAHGYKKEWVLYSLSMVMYFAVVEVVYLFVDKYLTVMLVPLFFVWWNIIILCFAIINTHEKSKQKYEADFARDIISSGRDHYEKMNEQYNALRILKHAYKFHLNTALDMLRQGETEKSNQYLKGLQTALEQEDAPFFCDNPVINSLITDYARRCRESGIELNDSVSIPADFSFLNYEMCIVLGNLLENAVEACRKLAGQNRIIELNIKPQGEQLATMVRNTFDGKIASDGERLISMKKDGGIGLQSVKAVTRKHCESFVTEFDDQWFSAFVLWKKGESVSASGDY